MGDGLEKNLRFGIALAFAIAGSLLGIVVTVLGFCLGNKYFGLSGIVLFVACVIWGIYLLHLENSEPGSKEAVPEIHRWNQDEPFENE